MLLPSGKIVAMYFMITKKKMLVKLFDCIPVNKLEVRLKNPRQFQTL